MADEMEDVRHQLSRHEREISSIRTDLATLTQGVKHLDASVNSHFADIKSFMEQHPARAGVSLKTVSNVIQTALHSALLVAAVVSSIVYVAANSNSVELALMKDRLARMEGAAPSILAAAPKPVKVVGAKH